MTLTILPVKDLPLIHAGDDLPALIADRIALQEGDIVSIASSVYSKAKGYSR
ncbi:MAG: coenzyme F420-0:L-glutamate ligase [Methanoregula sp.]|nr:coenzyme F420-0:L-glutamate ligase [Methanoregula sp.]